MGSIQTKTNVEKPNTVTSQSTVVTKNDNDNKYKTMNNNDDEKLKRIQQLKEEEQRKRSTLSGMELIHYVCRKRKKKFDQCDNKWYQSEFLSGRSLKQDDACADLYELYKRCIIRGIKTEIWEKQLKLPPPHPNSPLLEYDNDFDTDTTSNTTASKENDTPAKTSR